MAAELAEDLNPWGGGGLMVGTAGAGLTVSLCPCHPHSTREMTPHSCFPRTTFLGVGLLRSASTAPTTGHAYLRIRQCSGGRAPPRLSAALAPPASSFLGRETGLC